MRIESRRDSNELVYHACDGCGRIVDTLPALTSFRVELGHLDGTLHLCVRCGPGGPATYWARTLDDHVVESG